MIIYRSNQPPLLSEFGIQVPMLKGRAEKVFEEIKTKYGERFFSKGKDIPLKKEDLLRAHTVDFISRCEETPDVVIQEAFELINEDGSFNRYDPAFAKKPLSQLVELFRESCDASYLTVLEAHKKGFAYYLGGGFHHALAGQGRGFCLFNDIVIAAKKFQEEITDGEIWIVDIDAHKGCGTAAITEQDSSILTLSIHMKEGWPLDSSKFDEKGKLNPWFIPSTIDIEVSSGEEESYVNKLEEGLRHLEQQSSQSPKLCIVVDGSDPYEEDALPSARLLKLSRHQCLERNLLVYNFLKERSIPQAYLMSGGYGDKNWIIHHQFLDSVLQEF
ncbi:MAG: histone deacetylase [Bacteriovoracia bacterium]